jgi:long-chain fatty acid transport protein
MSNAFAAQADDPSALHYNPAGMTQLKGLQFMAGALIVGGSTDFTSPTGVTANGDRNGTVAWPPPGHTYITANLKDLGLTALGDLSAGIGLTVPFGSLTRWPNDGPFRTATTFSTLPLLDIKPTLAYKATENLSLGLGADIYTFTGLVGEGHAEKQSIPAAGVKTELNGKDCVARGPRDSSRIEGGVVWQGHRSWFQRQPAVYGVAQYGWEAAGEHRYRLPQSSDLTPERRIIG